MDCSLWFGLFPFRSPLLWESRFDFFSSAYLDVSVRQVPLAYLFYSTHVDRVWLYRVSPFGNLRIEAYLQLPEAYRSLPRLSSAPSAKAFTLCSFLLDQSDNFHCRFLKNSFFSGMFRCSDTTVCNFRYDNLLKIVFYFSIDSIFALLVFSFQGASDSVEPVSGDKEIRTPDPLLARQVLSQLSYTPIVHTKWAQVDSNHRPHAYQACALTT